MIDVISFFIFIGVIGLMAGAGFKASFGVACVIYASICAVLIGFCVALLIYLCILSIVSFFMEAMKDLWEGMK